MSACTVTLAVQAVQRRVLTLSWSRPRHPDIFKNVGYCWHKIWDAHLDWLDQWHAPRMAMSNSHWECERMWKWQKQQHSDFPPLSLFCPQNSAHYVKGKQLLLAPYWQNGVLFALSCVVCAPQCHQDIRLPERLCNLSSSAILRFLKSCSRNPTYKVFPALIWQSTSTQRDVQCPHLCGCIFMDDYGYSYVVTLALFQLVSSHLITHLARLLKCNNPHTLCRGTDCVHPPCSQFTD